MDSSGQYKYLVLYGMKKTVVRVLKKENIISEAKKQFGVEPAADMCVKLYEDDFEEYIDVGDLNALPDRGKLLFATADMDRYASLAIVYICRLSLFCQAH